MFPLAPFPVHRGSRLTIGHHLGILIAKSCPVLVNHCHFEQKSRNIIKRLPLWSIHVFLFLYLFLSLEVLSIFTFHMGSDEKIALLGAIQSLFEGSMYTFVFLWTPALSPNGEDIPHGFIFATFMLSSMLGSSIASRLMAQSSPKVESYMQIVFVISSASLLLPIITSVCCEILIPLISLYVYLNSNVFPC